MQPGQLRLTDAGQQDPPRRRGRRHRPEHLGLVTQHSQVADRLTAVGEHHRHIHRHTAGVVTGVATPQPGQGLAEGASQPGGVGEVGQQPRTGMSHHPVPSPVTMSLGRDRVVCTQKVPSVWVS